MTARAPVVTDLDPVHMVGIGGAGMSGLATILLARGIRVSGSDVKDSRGTAALRALGARVAIGHTAGNVGDARTLVVSSAIRPHNPELVEAAARGLPVLHRAQVLSLLMREKRGIAVVGTHGKTTTTSMLALIMEHAGTDPTFLVGGDLNERGTNAYHGGGEWLVAEADESDGSFLWLAPEIAVVTNIEAEHLDHYRDEAEIRETFLAFLGNVPPDGSVVCAIEDPGVRAIASRAGRRLVTFGIGEGEWTASREPHAGEQRVSVRREGRPLGTFRLHAPGEHNVRNALAAITAADAAGVAFDRAAEALERYQGVLRRFQRRGSARGVEVIDDYAHNPSKVRAALAAAREVAAGRVVAVFQPHLYSRTRHLGGAIGEALAAADLTIVTDVYGAREDPEPGVTGKLVVDGLLATRPRARVAYLPKRADVPPYVAQRARPGDTVLLIGAGDVTMLADEILHALGEGA